MKAYVYLTHEGKLHIRDKKYIDTENPSFFGDNRALIRAYWEVDTDNDEEMTNTALTWKRMKVEPKEAFLLFKSLEYDTNRLKQRIYDLKTMLDELSRTK